MLKRLLAAAALAAIAIDPETGRLRAGSKYGKPSLYGALVFSPNANSLPKT